MQSHLKSFLDTYSSIQKEVREEFVAAFKSATERIAKAEMKMSEKMDKKHDQNTEEIRGLMANAERAVNEMRSATDSTFAQMRKRATESITAMFAKMNVQGQMDKMYQEHEEMMEEMKAKMPDKEKMMGEMKAMIPTPTPPDTSEQVRDKLENLEGEERLDAKYIKGLEDLEKRLTDRISAIPHGGGRVSRNNIYKTLTPDGSTKIFSVPKNTGGVVIGSDFPTVLMEGAGFTVNASRSQITLTVDNAPSLNSQLVFIGNGIFNTL